MYAYSVERKNEKKEEKSNSKENSIKRISKSLWIKKLMII
jgi:hypothetical protein